KANVRLREQMFAVGAPLRRSCKIWRRFPVNNQCLTISVIRIAYGQHIGEMVAVGAEGNAAILFHVSVWTGLSIEYKARKVLVARAAKIDPAPVKDVLVV